MEQYYVRWSQKNNNKEVHMYNKFPNPLRINSAEQSLAGNNHLVQTNYSRIYIMFKRQRLKAPIFTVFFCEISILLLRHTCYYDTLINTWYLTYSIIFYSKRMVGLFWVNSKQTWNRIFCKSEVWCIACEHYPYVEEIKSYQDNPFLFGKTKNLLFVAKFMYTMSSIL